MPTEAITPAQDSEVTVEVDGDGPDIEIEVDDATDESDESADEPQEWTPPSQEEWAAKEALIKKLRKQEREAKRGKTADGGDPEDVAAKAYAEAESKFKPIVVKQAARAAFTEAGLILPKGKEANALARAMKLLDMDDIALSDDGDVEGLAEQIAELKADMPELFARKTTTRVDGAERGRSTPAAKSSAQRLAGMIG